MRQEKWHPKARRAGTGGRGTQVNTKGGMGPRGRDLVTEKGCVCAAGSHFPFFHLHPMGTRSTGSAPPTPGYEPPSLLPKLLLPYLESNPHLLVTLRPVQSTTLAQQPKVQASLFTKIALPRPTHLLAVSQEVVPQGELLIGHAKLLVPSLDGLGDSLPQLLGHLSGRWQGPPVVSTQSELQELLKVGHNQHPEQVRASKERIHNLEGGEADLGVLLAQLGHQQVVGVAQLFLR